MIADKAVNKTHRPTQGAAIKISRHRNHKLLEMHDYGAIFFRSLLSTSLVFYAVFTLYLRRNHCN